MENRLDIPTPTLAYVDRGNLVGLNYDFTISVIVKKDKNDTNNYYVKFTATGDPNRYIRDDKIQLSAFATDPADNTKLIATAALSIVNAGNDQATDVLAIIGKLYKDTGNINTDTNVASTPLTQFHFLDLGASAGSLLTPVVSTVQAMDAPPIDGTAITSNQAVELRFTLPDGMTIPTSSSLGIDVVISPLGEPKITVLDSLDLTVTPTPGKQQYSTPLGTAYCIKIPEGETTGSIFVASDHVAMISTKPAGSDDAQNIYFTGISTKEIAYPGAFPAGMGAGKTVLVQSGEQTIPISINNGKNFTENDNLDGYDMALIVNETKFTNRQLFSLDISPRVLVPISLFDLSGDPTNRVQYIFENTASGRILSSTPIKNASNGFRIVTKGYENQPDPNKNRVYTSPMLTPAPVSSFINWDLVSTNDGLKVLVLKSISDDPAVIKVNVYFNGWNSSHGANNNSLLDQAVVDDDDPSYYSYKLTKENLTGYGSSPGGGYSQMQIEYYTNIDGAPKYSAYIQYSLDTVP